MVKTISVQNRPIRLVDRDQMRRKKSGRTFGVPMHLKGMLQAIPSPPATFDGSKGRAIRYPVLGNDRYGDCYLADACHCIQTWTGNVGTEATFDEAAVIALYLKLSGGDNGLGDDQIFPAWKAGIFGHKILDDMTVDPRNDAAIKLGMWKFFGASYTAALLTGWYRSPQPGQVWDAGMGQADPSAGHAMHLSGYDSQYYHDETWGFDPPVRLTPAGLKVSDPEITVQFSLEMFNAQGIAPDGESYDQKAALWVACGGQNLPPSPFGPPGPIPPGPVPPGPTPPGPTPAGLRAFIDGWFNAEEAKLAVVWWGRWILPEVQYVHGLADQVMDSLNIHAMHATFRGPVKDIVDQIFATVAVQIDAAFPSRPLIRMAMQEMLTLLKAAADNWLVAQNL